MTSITSEQPPTSITTAEHGEQNKNYTGKYSNKNGKLASKN